MIRPLIIPALVVLLATALPVRAADPAPIEVPVIASLTGPIAFYGSAVAKGLEMLGAAVNKRGGVNGRPIAFVSVDDQSNPQVSAQLMSQQIAKGAQIVMDGGGTSSCLGAQSQLQSNGPVLYCMTPAVHPLRGSYTFVTSTPTLFGQYVVILRYFRLHGLTKVGMLSTTDATGQESDRLVDQAVQLPENKGVTINHTRALGVERPAGHGADRTDQGQRRTGDYRWSTRAIELRELQRCAKSWTISGTS